MLQGKSSTGTTVMCGVVGSNPLLEVIDGYVHRIWAGMAIDRVLQASKGIFVLRFAKMQDQITVLKRGVYFFDKKPFIVKAWNENLVLDISTLQSLPVWVQFLNLEIKYWGADYLSKLGSILGIPIKTNRNTKEKTAPGYARMLIEMSIEGSFPEHIDLVNYHDRVVRQFVKYEWKPTRCAYCKLIGHEEQGKNGE